MSSGQQQTQIERSDFISSDGSVFITAEEFAELKRRCPSIRNVRRMVQSACEGWLMRVPERKRKQVLIQWLLEKAETMRPPKPRRRRKTAMTLDEQYEVRRREHDERMRVIAAEHEARLSCSGCIQTKT